MMNGYHGRFLKINLTTQDMEDLPISEKDLQMYLGGSTLAAKLIYKHMEGKNNDLGPENPLVFATGPFTGTAIPMVSRYAICGISPHTGFWGEATSGGTFAFRLKGSGYDGIFIHGEADTPVYLYLDETNARLINAEEIWGRDCYETQELIKSTLGKKDLSVACIGSAGENKIQYAAIINDQGRAAGRCGLGALMGAKNLKAVVAGGKLRPNLADRKKIISIAKEATAEIKSDIGSIALKEYGTLFYMDMGMRMGDVPAKYFQKNVFPAEKYNGVALRRAYTVENYACKGCPIGCGRTVKNFRQEMKSVDGPEYETMAAFGPLCVNTNLDTIIEANHLCNAHGLDTISTGVSIAYAMYLYEKKVFTREQTGLEILWGDGQTVVELVKMIIAQEGIGQLLGKGVLTMARELGRDENEAAQVKGLEMPMHEGRAWQGLAVSYATSPRGACHLKGDYFNIDIHALQSVPEYNIFYGDRFSSHEKAKNAAVYQSLKDLYDSMPLCKFSNLSVSKICEIYEAITGWTMNPESLLKIGDRSINLKRMINCKLGLKRKDDHLPEICTKPLSEGSTAGRKPDMETLLKEYYAFRKWNWETGIPEKETLMELGLYQAAEEFY